MAFISNKGYAVVSSDPNTITELQDNHSIKKAIHQDGREWNFISTNSAGNKWKEIISEVSQLALVTEGSNTGYRLLGSNPSFHGDIGQNAVDLSTSSIPTTNGAIGDRSFASGSNTRAIGTHSSVMGDRSSATGSSSFSAGLLNSSGGNYSITLGRSNNVTAESSSGIGYLNSIFATNAHAIGFDNIIESTAPFGVCIGRVNSIKGSSSSAIGFNLNTQSLGETAVGLYNTEYTPASRTGWVSTDKVFTVGNGSFTTSLSDAFTIYKNGSAKIHPVDLSTVTNGSAGSLIVDSADGNKLKFHDGTSWKEVNLI